MVDVYTLMKIQTKLCREKAQVVCALSLLSISLYT